MPSKDVLTRLADLGIAAKSHSSSIRKEQAQKFYDSLKAEKQEKEAAKRKAAKKEAEQYDLDNLGSAKGKKASRIVPPHLRGDTQESTLTPSELRRKQLLREREAKRAAKTGGIPVTQPARTPAQPAPPAATQQGVQAGQPATTPQPVAPAATTPQPAATAQTTAATPDIAASAPTQQPAVAPTAQPAPAVASTAQPAQTAASVPAEQASAGVDHTGGAEAVVQPDRAKGQPQGHAALAASQSQQHQASPSHTRTGTSSSASSEASLASDTHKGQPMQAVTAKPTSAAPAARVQPQEDTRGRRGKRKDQQPQQQRRGQQDSDQSTMGQPGVPRPGAMPRPGQPTVSAPVRRRLENTMPREGSGRRAIPPPVKAAPKDHQAAGQGQRRGRQRDGQRDTQRDSQKPAQQQQQQQQQPQQQQPGARPAGGDFRDDQRGRRGGAGRRRKADPTPQELFEQENRPRRQRKQSGPVKAAVTSQIDVLPGVTVNELAKQFGVNPTDIIGALFRLGEMVTVTQSMSNDLVELVAAEMEADIVFITPEDVEFGDEIVDDEADLEDRPPVVTVMGHVDHGKTKLLDAIRHADVVAGEAGGITQHIGAYQVKRDGRKITFIDTPGHEAFTAMRARGASVTDVAILVVAADDGVKPQTIEAIDHINAAEVPLIVAINKIDKPDADPIRVRTQLTEHNLIAEEFGGQTTMVDVSALKKLNLDELLDLILLQADVEEVKSNPNREASGTVIEAHLDRGRGAVATVLIQNGTLRVGDNMVAGVASCKVRAMFDDKGDRVKKAEPAKPVQVIGWSDVPSAGDEFRVVGDERTARDIASSRKDRERKAELANRPRLTLEGLSTAVKEGQLTSVNLVIKGDVSGTVEAVAAKMNEIDVEGIRTRIVRQGVGAVTNDDVNLAEASDAIIIAFNVRAEAQARKAIEESGIDLRHYSIIYKAIEDIEAAIKGLLAPETHEVVLGRATVREVFKVPRAGFVFGSFVNEGNLKRNANVRVIRDGVVVATDTISSLRRFKDDVAEVAHNYECGIGLHNFQDIKVGDEMEAFEEQEIKRK